MPSGLWCGTRDLAAWSVQVAGGTCTLQSVTHSQALSPAELPGSWLAKADLTAVPSYVRTLLLVWKVNPLIL